jgi:crotonobetainyl-CoA:carnitine CoA-transferase CaiB-like acyl-CoA transferase
MSPTPDSSNSSSHEALASLRVVDLSSTIAGAYCTKLLAGFGAEVIKVEPPAGDPLRRRGPFPGDHPDPDASGLFLHLNAGKQSVTIDVTQPSGAALVRRLAARADVLVETEAPGRLAAYGLGYDELAAERPELVYVSITPFGQSGPYRDYQANSALALALTGLTYTTGDPDREPLTTGGDVAEYFAGEHAALAAMAALLQRRLTGHGQYVDVSLFEAVAMADEYNLTLYATTGAIRRRFHSSGLLGDHIALLPCADGQVLYQVGSAGYPTGVPLLTDRPELAEEPWLAGVRQRLANHERLKQILTEAFAGITRAEIVARAQELRMPFAPLLTVDEVLASEHLAERGFFVEVEQPGLGAVTLPGPPVRMSETSMTVGPAPALAEHLEAVLSEGLGFEPEEIAFLRRQGIV